MNPFLQKILSIELKGTEKQILWAKSIRSKKAKSIITEEVVEDLKGIIPDQDLLKINAGTGEGRKNVSLMVAAWACSNPEARWWIDTRDEDPKSWLTRAWWSVRKYCIENPFK